MMKPEKNNIFEDIKLKVKGWQMIFEKEKMTRKRKKILENKIMYAYFSTEK